MHALRRCTRDLRNRVGEARGLEGSHDLAVEMNSARQLVDVEFAIDQQDVEPGHPEQVGKIGADRPGSDDGDVEILATAHLARRPCVRCRNVGVAVVGVA